MQVHDSVVLDGTSGTLERDRVLFFSAQSTYSCLLRSPSSREVL